MQRIRKLLGFQNDWAVNRRPACSFVLALALFFLPAFSSQAQFLGLIFEIESELEAEEVSSLNFGEVVPNAGIIRIPLGDPNIGTYSITGPQNLEVDVIIDMPDFLEMAGDTPFRVPMELEVAYANRNENNTDHATPVSGSTVRFPLRADAPALIRPDQPAPSATAFIYVFGEIQVGDIPAGVYQAEVFMAVEYQ